MPEVIQEDEDEWMNFMHKKPSRFVYSKEDVNSLKIVRKAPRAPAPPVRISKLSKKPNWK
jgi:hypothetical protein